VRCFGFPLGERVAGFNDSPVFKVKVLNGLGVCRKTFCQQVAKCAFTHVEFTEHQKNDFIV